MKFLSVFVLLTVAVCYIRADDTTKEAAMAIAAQCKDEAGATDDDVEAFKNHEAPGSEEAKCMRACVMKKFGVMDDEGKLVRDVAIGLGKHMIHDESKKELAVTLVEACEALEVDANPCEAAAEYGACFKTHAAELGLADDEA